MGKITVGTGLHLASTSLFAVELEEDQLCNYYLHALPPSDHLVIVSKPPRCFCDLLCLYPSQESLDVWRGSAPARTSASQKARITGWSYTSMMHICCVCIDCYWLVFILLSNGLCSFRKWSNGSMSYTRQQINHGTCTEKNVWNQALCSRFLMTWTRASVIQQSLARLAWLDYW